MTTPAAQTELNAQFAKMYLEISISDSDAAQLLYDNKYYPQAIFLLQQASEKLIKAMGYHFNILDEGNIAHCAWKVYFRSISDFSKETGLKIDTIFYNTLAWQELSAAYGFKRIEDFEKFLSKKENLKHTSFNNTIVSDLVAKYSNIDKVMRIFKTETEERNWWDTLSNILKELINGASDFLIRQYTFALFSVDISIILYNSTESTRYGSKNAISPNRIYNDTHPLVTNFAGLTSTIRSAQEYVKSFVR